MSTTTPLTATLQGRADAAGQLELAFPTGGTVPSGVIYLIQRVAITVPDTAASPSPSFTLYVGTERSNETRRDGTAYATVDAADYVHPLPVGEGQRLFGLFDGCDLADACVMHVQYVVARRGSV